MFASESFPLPRSERRALERPDWMDSNMGSG
jgi:hypothetical protein